MAGFPPSRTMFTAAALPSDNKSEQYAELAEQARGLLHGEHDRIANAANFAALVYNALPDLNWAGFYFFDGSELVVGHGAGCFERLLTRDLMHRGLLGNRRALLGDVEVAHQLLFEVDVEVGFIRSLSRRRSLFDRRRMLPRRLTGVETHDPGQLRERIIVGDGVVVGYSQLGSVCHYCSRTRTQSDAMDVAQGWPLPAQCGQKVTGFLVKPNAFRWAQRLRSTSGRTLERPKQPAPALVWHASIVGR